MGNLVACKGCNGQVSAAATVCPTCGHPIKRTMGAGKIILIVVAAVVVLGAIGAVQRMEEQQSREKQQTTEKPQIAEKQHNDVAPAPPPRIEAAAPPPPPPVAVTARKLASDYEANEVSADAVYRGKVLSVSGVVDAIKKDFMDEPFVVLRTANQFMGVHAKFKDDGGLAGLKPGTAITIRCIGDNVILGSPMLKECAFE